MIVPSAKQFIDEADAVLSRVEKEVKPMVEDKAVAKIVEQGKSSIRWLRSYLEQKDTDKVGEKRNEIQDQVRLIRVHICAMSIMFLYLLG